MLYYFPHPGNPNKWFTYNDQTPLIVRQQNGIFSEQITLTLGNINAEEFFYCLIKTKFVSIESRSKGYAHLDSKLIPIPKPYDCKSVVHKLLGITSEKPLIINDRRQNRYMWPFTDEEMRRPPFENSGENPLFGKGKQYFSSAPGSRADTWEIEIVPTHGVATSSGVPGAPALASPRDSSVSRVPRAPQNRFEEFEREADAAFEAHRTQAQTEFTEGFGEFMSRHEDIRNSQGDSQGKIKGKAQEKIS